MNKIAGLLVGIFLVAVTLTWDPPPGATGSKLHCGSSSGNYNTTTDVGALVEHTIDLPGSYYCAASAYNTTEESGYSNELFFTVRLGAPTNLRQKL